MKPGAPTPRNARPRLRDLSLGTDFLRRLESLTVAAGRLLATGGIATRAGTVRGGRVEFLEHRGYVEGDDVRDLDWNVYGRLNELFVKVFGAEREKRVHILLDLSPSMGAVPGKELFACRLASALAHVALAGGDTVELLPTGAGSPPPARKGLRASRELIGFLERQPPGGPVDWATEVERFTAERRLPGATVVISDFWTEGAVQALAALPRHRQEVSLLHTLTPEELRPPLAGNLRLEDAETGEEVSLALGSRDLDAYSRSVENHITTLAASARRHGMRHLLCQTDRPFEHTVLIYLRRGGLLR